MVLANAGLLPHDAPECGMVFKFILPLAIPMLLFSADLRCVCYIACLVADACSAGQLSVAAILRFVAALWPSQP